MKKYLFFALIFLMPLNLGKHFIFSWCYVDGILVDYLIPTVYITDLIVAAIILLNLVTFLQDFAREKGSTLARNPLRFSKYIAILIFFLFSVFLSVLVSAKPYAALYAFTRLLLYSMFAVWVSNNIIFIRANIINILKISLISIFLLSVLSLAQFYKQSSVFNNYLFFGEQPYSKAAAGIVKKTYPGGIPFGGIKIPPYGTFRHPNIFGGYLSIFLIWFIAAVGLKQKLRLLLGRKWIVFICLVLILGSAALFLTLSYLAWFSFAFGLLTLFIVNKKINLIYFSICTVVLIMLLGVFLPFFYNMTKGFSFVNLNPSIYRRVYLIQTVYQSIRENFMYGVGFNSSSIVIGQAGFNLNGIRFIQPVHNVFLLILAESGIFAFVFFCSLLVLALLNFIQNINKASLFPSNFISSDWPDFLQIIPGISLLQIIVLSSFDHYIITIQQTQLLFFLVIGLFGIYKLGLFRDRIL